MFIEKWLRLVGLFFNGIRNVSALRGYAANAAD